MFLVETRQVEQMTELLVKILEGDWGFARTVWMSFSRMRQSSEVFPPLQKSTR